MGKLHIVELCCGSCLVSAGLARGWWVPTASGRLEQSVEVTGS